MRRVWGGLDQVLSTAIGAGLLAIFFLNMYQVGGRYLFGIGSVWIPDVTRLLFIWMVFLGTALVHLRQKHLVIDFVKLRLPPRVRETAEALIAVGMLALAGVLMVAGWRIAMIRMEIPYTGWEIPTGYAYLAVPVCGALIALTSLGELWRWRRRRGAPGEGEGLGR